MTSVTIQRFHEDIEAAEQASASGPVFITEDGDPKRVLIDIAEYRTLKQQTETLPAQQLPDRSHLSIAEALGMPADEEYIEWEPPRLSMKLRDVNFE